MNNKLYTCLYCGRNLGAPCVHRCKGTLRKRKLLFKHRITKVIIGTKSIIGSLKI